ARQRTSEARAALHERKPRGRGRAQAAKASGREDVGGDVLHDPGEIAQLAVGVDESGLLGATGTEAYELHGCLLGEAQDEAATKRPASRSRVTSNGGSINRIRRSTPRRSSEPRAAESRSR